MKTRGAPIISLCILILGAWTSLPRATGAEVPAGEEIRPFDTVYLKASPGEGLVGTLEIPWDPLTTTRIVLRTTKGATMTIPVSDLDRVIPRQGAEEVYLRKLARVKAEKEPARRAALEAELGLWSKEASVALGGKAPREESALGHLLNAVELDPKLSDVYPHILDLLPFAPALEGSPEDIERHSRLSALAARGSVDEPELDYRMGLLLAGPLGQPGKARPYLERFLAKGLSNQGQIRKARSALCDIFVAEGSIDLAIRLYESALPPASEGGSPRAADFDPVSELARLYLLRGRAEDLKKAREYATRAQALQPDFSGAALELAAIDSLEGQVPAAEKRLKETLAKDPTSIAAAIDLAVIELRTGRGAAARKRLDALVPGVEGPEAARLHIALGSIREAAGDLPGAVEEFQRAVALAPTLLEAKVHLGFALAHGGRADEARAVARELFAAAPSSRWVFAAANRVAAEADQAQGKLPEAARALERAAEVDSTDPTLLARLGMVLISTGRIDAGYAALSKARTADPRPEILNAMAYCHYQRGQLAEARKLFEEVLKLVKAPSKQVKGPPPRVPPERAYALRGRELIDDQERLQVWSADFKGPDSPTVGGWLETERFGIEISKKAGHLDFVGKQSASDDGATLAMLERAIESGNFERVSLSMKVSTADTRAFLRLEGTAARSGASTGIAVLRDSDGSLKPLVKSTQGDWEAVAPTEPLAPETGKPVYAGGMVWPDDGAFHTIEIRRSSRVTARDTSRVGTFDVYFDGEPMAWNLRVQGMAGQRYDAGIGCQASAPGRDVAVMVESFKVFREKIAMKKGAMAR